MILIAYIAPALLLLAGVAVPRARSVAGRNSFLNLLSLVQAVWYLALTIWVLTQVKLPIFFFNDYLFIDSLAIYEVLIASIVFLLSSVYARGYVKSLLDAGEIDPRSLRLFYGGFNLLFLATVLAFFSNNLALFWINLETTTILSGVLIVTLNAKDNIVAALKYVFIASTAMLFSIIGLIVLFAMSKQVAGTGTLNWDMLMTQAKDFPPQLFTFVFIFTFIGFAAKAGIVPFHTWLPQAHAKAPSVISTLLSAVLLNAGVYGILRLFAIAHQAGIVSAPSVLLIAFGVLSIALAAFSMLPRTNIKKLIAFSSIEHMGLVLIRIGIGTPLVLFWVLFHTLAHSLIKALLFFSSGILHRQYESNKIDEMANVMSLQPLASFGLIAGGVAITGIPLFPIFLSKLFILIGLSEVSLPVLLLVLLLLLVVAAAFAAVLVRMFSRFEKDGAHKRYSAPWTMKAPILLLFASVLVMGIYLPTGYSDMLNGIVSSLGF